MLTVYLKNPITAISTLLNTRLDQPHLKKSPATTSITRHPRKKQKHTLKRSLPLFCASLLCESIILQIITTTEFTAPTPPATGQVLADLSSHPNPTPTTIKKQRKPLINTTAHAASTPKPTPKPQPFTLQSPLRSYVLTQYYSSYHLAIDMAASYGTPIYASGPGTVAATGYIMAGGGNMVQINHPHGYTTYYAHLSSIQTKPGAKVTHKTQIGRIGSTGWATGPHLHFIVQKNHQFLNPLAVMK